MQTLDECLVIIPKVVFDMLQFDEEVCDNWHVYAVDYSLSVKALGFDAYAIPMFIHHRSTGASTPKNPIKLVLYPEGFYKTLKMVVKKHKNQVKWIYTTCGDWNTSRPLVLQRIKYLAEGGVKLLRKSVRK